MTRLVIENPVLALMVAMERARLLGHRTDAPRPTIPVLEPGPRVNEIAKCTTVAAVDELMGQLEALPASRGTKRRWYRVAEARKRSLATEESNA